jgi:ankyrin repeat protein
MSHGSRRGDTLAMLLAAGAYLEPRSDDGLTVLLKSVKRNLNQLEIEGLLVEGAKIDARDFDGRTILHLASAREQSEAMIRLLVNAGAGPRWVDFFGNTLLHQAARKCPSYHGKEQCKLFEALADLGVSPSTRNYAGQSLLYVAAGMNRDRNWGGSHEFDPYAFVLGPQCNLDINEPDSRGIRPTHLAAGLSGATSDIF